MLKFDAPVSSRVVEAQKKQRREDLRVRELDGEATSSSRNDMAPDVVYVRAGIEHIITPAARGLGQSPALAGFRGMSSSVTLSIATNSAIAASKGFGWFVTGSPTLFAETIHSLADVGNQLLLKVGEVRGRGGPDRVHPFGRGQEKFFWALVSAVSVFFVGCGINVYHGVHALLSPVEVAPFTPFMRGPPRVRAGARVVDLRRRLEGDRRDQTLAQESQ